MKLNPMGALSAVLAMVVLLVSPATFAADEFRLQVSTVDGQSTSGDVLVSVRYQASTGVGAAQFEIVYDPLQLEFRDLVAGSDLKSALLEQKQRSPGRVRAAFVTSDAISGQGELLIVTFSPKARDWNPSSITIEKARAWEQAKGSEILVTMGLGAAGETPPTPPATRQPESSPPAPSPPPATTSPVPNVTEVRLPGWVYAVGGAGAATIVILLVLVLRAGRAKP